MKKSKFLFAFLVGFLLVSCSKEGCNNGFVNKLSPHWYELYFELLKPDGSDYNNEEVRVSYQLKVENGELIPPNASEWYDLYEVNYQDSIPNVKIFGLGCEGCEFVMGITYAGGLTDECGDGSFENWTRELFYLLEFPNQEIDTLKIVDILEPGNNRSFKYYINNVEKELQQVLYTPYLQVVH